MIDAKTCDYGEWLRKAGDAEAAYDITIGTSGFRPRTQRTIPIAAMGLKAIGKLVELKRRDAGLSIDELAEKASVSADDVLKLEWGQGDEIGSNVLNAVAKVLALPLAKLASMLSAAERGTRQLQDAAVRFTARAAGFDALKPVEREALSEFIGVLEGSL